jgi:hypothetical protein
MQISLFSNSTGENFKIDTGDLFEAYELCRETNEIPIMPSLLRWITNIICINLPKK